MVDRTVARRYAEAFVNALEGSDRLSAGLEDLDQVAGMYGQSKDLRRFLGSPEIGPEDKERVLDRALAAGAAPEMMGLLHLLLKKDRVEKELEEWEAEDYRRARVATGQEALDAEPAELDEFTKMCYLVDWGLPPQFMDEAAMNRIRMR